MLGSQIFKIGFTKSITNSQKQNPSSKNEYPSIFIINENYKIFFGFSIYRNNSKMNKREKYSNKKKETQFDLLRKENDQ